jgi:hypothetical protein
MTTPQYYWAINADTGQPTLAAYFTAPLCTLEDARLYDVPTKISDLVDDVRDHLDQLGIPIRPTILQKRVRILQTVEEGEKFAQQPLVYATVMAFFTDAAPEDPRLVPLASGFHSSRLDAAVEFELPTVESEAELERSIAEAKTRDAAYIAKSKAESTAASDRATTAAGSQKASADDVLDELYG